MSESGCCGNATLGGRAGWLFKLDLCRQEEQENNRRDPRMYIKFCRSYEGDKKDELTANMSPDSKLCVRLEEDKGA